MTDELKRKRKPSCEQPQSGPCLPVLGVQKQVTLEKKGLLWMRRSQGLGRCTMSRGKKERNTSINEKNTYVNATAGLVCLFDRMPVRSGQACDNNN